MACYIEKVFTCGTFDSSSSFGRFHSIPFSREKLVSSFSLLARVKSSLHIMKSLNVKRKTSSIRSSVHDTQYEFSMEFTMGFVSNHPGIAESNPNSLLFHVTKCNSIYKHRSVSRSMRIEHSVEKLMIYFVHYYLLTFPSRVE